MMIEKRFDYIYKDVKNDRGLSETRDFFIDNFTNKKYDLTDENDIGYFLDLLDKLSEKNRQLNEENEELISTKCTDCELINLQTRKIDSLEKENEQLKARNSYNLEDATMEIGELKEENEQLEQKIKNKNEYQRILEAKIRRLKDRIKVLEK